MKLPCLNQLLLVGMVFAGCGGTSLRASVYATDIRVNGHSHPGVIVPGGSVAISYILNDSAACVCAQIFYGTNLIKTLNCTNAGPGLNSFVWDGSTDTASNLAAGIYTVRLTAASAGYDDWTAITGDGAAFAVPVPRGISVNQNTNSFFYGRVFVANAYPPFGIFKFNADGSPADEGGFSTGGLDWGSFPHYSPWKIAISGDDRVYIDDFSSGGIVYAFDQTIGTNRGRAAVRLDNYPISDPDPELSGLAVTGTGTNTLIWMTDENPDNSAGIIFWPAAANGLAAANDTGTIAVPPDPNFLSAAPYDITLDSNNVIYTVQLIGPGTNSACPLISFPPYPGFAETNANWAVAGGDPSMVDAYGISVDPTATYLAVAVVGSCDPENSPCGGLYLYAATNGQFLTNLDQTGGDAYYDVAWDAVGNLYALDGTLGVWRAYSPPGTNQAVTVAVPFIEAYTLLTPPSLNDPALSAGRLHFTLDGQSNVTYIVQRSCDLTNWIPALTNFSPGTTRPISLPAPATHQYYRAVSVP